MALPIACETTHNGDGPGGVAQRQSGPRGQVASSNLAGGHASTPTVSGEKPVDCTTHKGGSLSRWTCTGSAPLPSPCHARLPIRLGKVVPPVAEPLQQRRHPGQAVVRTRQMRPRAEPRPVRRVTHQPRTHRIAFYVPGLPDYSAVLKRMVLTASRAVPALSFTALVTETSYCLPFSNG